MLYLTNRFYSHKGQVFERLSGEIVPIEDVLEQLAAHESLYKTFRQLSESAILHDEKHAYAEAAECVALVME